MTKTDAPRTMSYFRCDYDVRCEDSVWTGQVVVAAISAKAATAQAAAWAHNNDPHCDSALDYTVSVTTVTYLDEHDALDHLLGRVERPGTLQELLRLAYDRMDDVEQRQFISQAIKDYPNLDKPVVPEE